MDAIGWIGVGLAAWIAASVAVGLLLGQLVRHRVVGFAAPAPPSVEKLPSRRRLAA